MRTTQSALSALPIALIFFSSCQREIDPNILSQPQNINDSTRIERIVFLDTTLPAPLDSFYQYTFIYDAQKRVIRKLEIERTVAGLDTLHIFYSFYNGNDTLPFRIEYDAGAATGFLFYDNNGRIIKDSTFKGLPPFLEVNRYNYSSLGVIISKTVIDPMGNITNVMDTIYQTSVGRNILIQKDTSTVMPGLTQAIHLNYTYDNRPNPLKGSYFWIYPYYEGDDMLEYNWSDNNFLETTFERKDITNGSVLDVDHYRYSYQYGTNGMPKIAWEREVNDNTVNKYLFFYTK